MKNNQPTLAQAVGCAFADQPEGLARGRLRQDIDVTKDHGRIETRRCVVSTEWRYYISSRELDATQFNQAIRRRWSIGNGYYWVLDVNFREDDSRIRVGHGAENFAILRRMALNLINQDKTIKASKKAKRQMAAWSTTRLQELLGLQRPAGPRAERP